MQRSSARISKTTDMKKATKITGTCGSCQIISICPNIVRQISQGQIPQSHVWILGLKPDQQRYPPSQDAIVGKWRSWGALKFDYTNCGDWHPERKNLTKTSLHRIKGSNSWKTDLFRYWSTGRVPPTFLGLLKFMLASFLSYIYNLCYINLLILMFLSVNRVIVVRTYMHTLET